MRPAPSVRVARTPSRGRLRPVPPQCDSDSGIASPAARAHTFFDARPGAKLTRLGSMSIFVTCNTPDEVDALFGKLSSDGSVLMPLDDYGFSPRFGWCTDRHGVSWQVGCT